MRTVTPKQTQKILVQYELWERKGGGFPCLKFLLFGWPQAYNRASVLYLYHITHVDTVSQLNHFIHPVNVSHPMIREKNDIQVLLQTLVLSG